MGRIRVEVANEHLASSTAYCLFHARGVNCRRYDCVQEIQGPLGCGGCGDIKKHGEKAIESRVRGTVRGEHFLRSGLVDDLENIVPVNRPFWEVLTDTPPQWLAYHLKNHLAGGAASTSQDKVLGLVCTHLAPPALVAAMSRWM